MHRQICAITVCPLYRGAVVFGGTIDIRVNPRHLTSPGLASKHDQERNKGTFWMCHCWWQLVWESSKDDRKAALAYVGTTTTHNRANKVSSRRTVKFVQSLCASFIQGLYFFGEQLVHVALESTLVNSQALGILIKSSPRTYIYAVRVNLRGPTSGRIFLSPF